MKKLLTLKKWLTLHDTARHLAIVFGEEVSEADVLRLALEKHLKLSVYFINHAKAQAGKVVPIEEAEYTDSLLDLSSIISIPEEFKGRPIKVMQGINLDDKQVLNLSDEVVTLQGVYDLAMFGNEILDLEHQYQNLTGGPSVTLQGLEGSLVTDDAETVYRILENFDENEYQPGSKAHLREIKRRIENNEINPDKKEELTIKYKENRKIFLDKQKEYRENGNDINNYYPASGLPEDSVLVIRTDALRDFEQSLSSEPALNDKPITATERNTLLTIISALCKSCAVDTAGRGAANQISRMTDLIGAPITDETIRNVLKKIPDAVGRRMK